MANDLQQPEEYAEQAGQHDEGDHRSQSRTKRSIKRVVRRKQMSAQDLNRLEGCAAADQNGDEGGAEQRTQNHRFDLLLLDDVKPVGAPVEQAESHDSGDQGNPEHDVVVRHAVYDDIE